MSWGNDAIILRDEVGRKILPIINHSVVGHGCNHDNVSGFDYQLIINIKLATYAWYFIDHRIRELLPLASMNAFCKVDTGSPESFFLPDIAKQLKIAIPQNWVGSGSDDLVDVAFPDPVFDTQTGALLSFWWFRHEVGVKIGCHDVTLLARFPLQRITAPNLAPIYELNSNEPPNAISRLGLRGLIDNRMLCLTPDTVFALARLHKAQNHRKAH